MLLTIQKEEDRGYVQFDWLTSAHSFSFGDYYDPNNMGFGALRVLNDDQIQGGGGFPPHSHREMEIFTIPLTGALSHQDSTGTSSTIRPGDIQIMSAGTGVRHSEFNASKDEELSLLQIWITPNKSGILARYEEKHFSFLEEKNTLHSVITPTGSNGSLTIYQDAYVSIGTWDQESSLTYTVNNKANGVYIFIIEGEVKIENSTLMRRDATMIKETEEVTIQITKDSMVLIIEVPTV